MDSLQERLKWIALMDNLVRALTYCKIIWPRAVKFAMDSLGISRRSNALWKAMVNIYITILGLWSSYVESNLPYQAFKPMILERFVLASFSLKLFQQVHRR